MAIPVGATGFAGGVWRDAGRHELRRGSRGRVPGGERGFVGARIRVCGASRGFQGRKDLGWEGM